MQPSHVGCTSSLSSNSNLRICLRPIFYLNGRVWFEARSLHWYGVFTATKISVKAIASVEGSSCRNTNLSRTTPACHSKLVAGRNVGRNQVACENHVYFVTAEFHR